MDLSYVKHNIDRVCAKPSHRGRKATKTGAWVDDRGIVQHHVTALMRTTPRQRRRLSEYLHPSRSFLVH